MTQQSVTESNASAQNLQRWTNFVLAGTVVGFVWLLVLPALANQPDMKAYIEDNERYGIDPSVRYYSELPCMREIILRVDQLHRTHGAEFWRRPTNDSAKG